MSDVTRILDRVQQGDPRAASELLPLVYEELRKLAAYKMAHEAAGHTLQPTALVHEAWLRLVVDGPQRWNSRGHFFAAAAEAMRRILIETARRKLSQRRGGGLERVELDESLLVLERPSDEMLAVNEALEKLAREDRLAADLVNLRYFVGMTLPEAAEALGLSPRTADRLWAFARTWLRLEIEGKR
ncbi:MAG: sigma-70 family RNA polymerase sigma factor [Verrucomicrobia bacterium]|nr:sigma-70 family RNA polymerase sigma factor [Verrucomicrobiota bacterium]